MLPVESRLHDRANRISSTAPKWQSTTSLFLMLIIISQPFFCQYFSANLCTFFDKYVRAFLFISTNDWRINKPKPETTSSAGISVPLSVPQAARIKYHIYWIPPVFCNKICLTSCSLFLFTGYDSKRAPLAPSGRRFALFSVSQRDSATFVILLKTIATCCCNWWPKKFMKMSKKGLTKNWKMWYNMPTR